MIRAPLGEGGFCDRLICEVNNTQQSVDSVPLRVGMNPIPLWKRTIKATSDHCSCFRTQGGPPEPYTDAEFDDGEHRRSFVLLAMLN